MPAKTVPAKTVAKGASAWDKALDLLSRRPHFRRELAAKLAARSYDADEVETTLERLTQRGFVDDRQLARDFVSARLEREPTGRRRLAAELARRGVADDIVRDTLDEALPQDDLEAARQAAERWQRKSARPASARRSAALARHLERRGFSHHAILTVLQESAGEDAEDPFQE